MLRQALAALLSLAVTWGCGRHVELGRDRQPAAVDASLNNLADAASDAGATGACTVTPCRGKIYACGDCIDNDADGLIDSADPECLGPCDNTEDSYFSGLPGQNSAPCKQDCYFDQGSGAGNDTCYWSQKCDPLSVAPDYPPSGDAKCAYDVKASVPGTSASCSDLAAQQSDACIQRCLPLTPNGCDCFGCCELPAQSGNFVWIGSTSGGLGSCDPAHLSDPASCHPCTPVLSCFNDCNPCEVCAGRPTPASDCAPADESRCPAGVSPCGTDVALACAAPDYCIGGCCVTAPN